MNINESTSHKRMALKSLRLKQCSSDGLLPVLKDHLANRKVRHSLFRESFKRQSYGLIWKVRGPSKAKRIVLSKDRLALRKMFKRHLINVIFENVRFAVVCAAKILFVNGDRQLTAMFAAVVLLVCALAYADRQCVISHLADEHGIIHALQNVIHHAV